LALIDDFKARFPEFTTATVDAKFPLFESVWPCYYGGVLTDDCDKAAILLLLAHLFVLETQAGSTSRRLENSRSVGSVSVGYANTEATGESGFFWTTKYGQQFMLLTQPYGAKAFFV